MVAATTRLVSSRDAGTIIPPPLGVAGLTGPYVWDASSAMRVPAVGRAVQLYGGLTKQMPMNAYKAGQPVPRPRLLDAPDPTRGGPWFVENSVVDYLLNGNAISLVTARGADGWPLSLVWLPASWVYIQWMPWDENDIAYFYLGQKLPFDDVVHVRRGADRNYPVRGIGVVEQNLPTLDRAAMEEEYERSALAGGAVPSVAIITPNATLTQDVADEAKTAWLDKFAGPNREPVILPNGTVVQPLAWSPSDTQLTEARHMTLTDIANMFNLDSYWLGAPVAGMTYRTAGPQYQQVLRTSLEPVLADFESVWSNAWLPRGTTIKFDRNQLLRDDLGTTATALQTLITAGIISANEARAYLDLSTASGDLVTAPGPPPPPAPPPPAVPAEQGAPPP